jgi:hypothetical protein
MQQPGCPQFHILVIEHFCRSIQWLWHGAPGNEDLQLYVHYVPIAIAMIFYLPSRLCLRTHHRITLL